MTHVALYCRVSLTDGSQTNENQRLRLIEYAERNGRTYDIYEETESTRKTRPIKQALLQKLRAGEYDAVIIYKLDRWARSTTELILDTKELLDKGVGFISLSDNLDFSSAAGNLQFQILCAISEFERELIRQRTLTAMARIKQTKAYVFTGRKKGSKDKKKRKTDGYFAREEKKRQMARIKLDLPPNN